jgi:menaquinone-9 beta-reductase
MSATLLPERADVAIVGAGTAGAAAALFCAKAGLRVVAIDRAPLARAGAHWLNAVPANLFDRAGLARPSGDELASPPLTMHLFAGRGPERAIVRGHDALEVDMARLVRRLQTDAREAGAMLEGGVRALGVDGATLRTDHGSVTAESIIDASGLAGARLLGDPRTGARDLCAAAQEVRALRDRGAAEAFFRGRGMEPGDVLVLAGLAGGYSVLNVRLAHDGVSMLSGTVPADGQPSGRIVIEQFAAEHERWIGEPIHAGARAIPLGRPVDVLSRGRVALLGDSARQVFAAHGSGVGAGLVAARVLADELAGGRGLDGYAVRWHREHGGLLAAYDVFRRFSQDLPTDALARMIRARLLDAATMVPAMQQKAPTLAPSLLLAKAPAALREPRLLAGLGEVFARMAMLRALYARHPEREGAPRARWARAAARIAGDAT